MNDIYQTLEAEINKSNATFGETMNAIKRLLAVYMRKGDDLLNSVKIQKVNAEKRMCYRNGKATFEKRNRCDS